MRKDYQPGVLAPSQKSESEIAARDEFNRKQRQRRHRARC